MIRILPSFILLTLTAAATAGSALPKSATDMEVAHGTDADAIANKILSSAPSTSPSNNEYAIRVIREFQKELTSSNPDARFYTAKIFAQLGTLSCDRILEQMLKNTDPAVRKWAANGLGILAPVIKAVQGQTLQAAISSLQSAEKSETDSDASDEIIKTLKLYE